MLSNNPGEYRCKVTRGGDIVREFIFTIGKDGKVVRPACQGPGGKIVTSPNMTLIKVTHKKGSDAKYNVKAFAKGSFFGRGCTP